MLNKIINNNPFIRKLKERILNTFFKGSKNYWEKRYSSGGNSGVGSYGEKAIYKATFLNHFIKENKIERVLEWGCGDGNQLALLEMPKYLGYDVSPTIIAACKETFKNDATKSFELMNARASAPQTADLSLSLDVIYHLVEDTVYHYYMEQLFSSAKEWVIIYAWDVDAKQKYHVRHRKFSAWVNEHAKAFTLFSTQKSEKGFCDFFIYERSKKL